MAGPFPNRNIYACFAELGLPVTVWLAVKDRNPVWWFASSAIVGSVLSAGTRAGAIIILCECAILCVLAGRRRAVPILGGAAIVAVIASGGTLMTRLSYANPFELRSDLALSSVRLALERPLLGWGLGSYASVYPQFATFDVGRRVDHAHNDWLEWAAEAGIPAGLLIAGFFLSSLRGVTRHWWTLGIAAVCIHACVDYPLQRQGVALWVILLVAAITAARKAERDDGQRPPCAREVTEPVRQPGRAQPGLR
jgi:O-antigen ligase